MLAKIEIIEIENSVQADSREHLLLINICLAYRISFKFGVSKFSQLMLMKIAIILLLMGNVRY